MRGAVRREEVEGKGEGGGETVWGGGRCRGTVEENDSWQMN